MDDDDPIDTLNELIEICKDGEHGFRSCAEQVKSAELATLLARRADDCRWACAELQQRVAMLGAKPDLAGSAAGALHRGWVALRGTLAAYEDLALLKECGRGEDVAARSYRRALDKSLPEPIRSLVESQYLGVRRNFEQICELRDGMQQVRALHS